MLVPSEVLCWHCTAAVLKFLRETLKFFPPPEKVDEDKGYVRRKIRVWSG